ncbi:hypothetical protein PR202_ga11835 [Eleusine coracana subsp. coracana]|uniref:Uncharacterized protein n=1 Tax=Eleusine coracana subsp. coracana TaxID=191504 RepID=A0AAV5CAH6_ELECO|nr:hypothetical protein PR202_ga11835 [Eleusine coracana subsp. coracana]
MPATSPVAVGTDENTVKSPRKRNVHMDACSTVDAKKKIVYDTICATAGSCWARSALGRNRKYLDAAFPPESMTVLDTVAKLSLLIFLFLVGLELDLSSIRPVHGAEDPGHLPLRHPAPLRRRHRRHLLRVPRRRAARAPFLVYMGMALSVTANDA